MDITELQNELDRIILERGQAAFGTDVVIRYKDGNASHIKEVEYFNGRINICVEKKPYLDMLELLLWHCKDRLCLTCPMRDESIGCALDYPESILEDAVKRLEEEKKNETV